MRDFTLLYAPNVNSYKRFADGSFAPTAVAWGLDNRTCAVRLVGHGPSARMENRLPGGDVNPYLALAAMLAGGLHGIEHELELEDELVGNAYTSDKPHVPATRCEAARDAFHGSSGGAGRLRRRGRGPLHEHGRRRARRLRRRRDRLGAAPRLREDVTDGRRLDRADVHRSSTRRPSSRSPSARSPSVEETDAADRAGARRLPGLARRRARRAGPAAAPVRRRRRRARRGARRDRGRATPATPGATPPGRPATSATA